MEPARKVIDVDQAVKKIKALRRNSETVPHGIPKQPVNSDETNEGKYWQENLADPGYINYISGTGYGRELW